MQAECGRDGHVHLAIDPVNTQLLLTTFTNWRFFLETLFTSFCATPSLIVTIFVVLVFLCNARGLGEFGGSLTMLYVIKADENIE